MIGDDIMGNNSEHENKFIHDSFDDINSVDDMNQKNGQAYNNLMNRARNRKDHYWDINHPVVKTILIVLFLIALLGSLYYIIMWFISN